jgi:hypothetical protein
MCAQRKTVLDRSPFVLYAQLDGSHGVQEMLTVTKVLLDGCSVADHAYLRAHQLPMARSRRRKDQVPRQRDYRASGVVSTTVSLSSYCRWATSKLRLACCQRSRPISGRSCHVPAPEVVSVGNNNGHVADMFRRNLRLFYHKTNHKT